MVVEIPGRYQLRQEMKVINSNISNGTIDICVF